jgi:hypothetical protein
MIETWNEFHEGTDIAESKEYGRQYIELTRKYSDLFKQGWKPPWPKGSFNKAKEVSAAASDAKVDKGLKPVTAEDGQTELRDVQGRRGWFGKRFRDGHSLYLYFAVDDSFKSDGTMNATVELEYFDAAPGQLSIEFDGGDTTAPFAGAYSATAKVPLTGDRRWKAASLKLDGARFLNSQNAGADFRVVAGAPEFGLSHVRLKRR